MSAKDSKAERNAFCAYYAMLGDVTEAAVRAGIPKEAALEKGAAYLSGRACKRRIGTLREALADPDIISAGLRRLAFGSCTDAVYLVFCDELPPPSVIEGLDLFNVSEIKRVKGGGVEVKLFDRLKALEKLFELGSASSDRSKAESLLEALTAGSEEGEE